GAGRLLPGDRHDPEQRLRQQILTGPLRIRTVGSVAGRRRIDQRRLAPPQRVAAEAELVHDARTEILGHHVGAVDELERDRSALGRLQIERDAAFVAVGAHVYHSLAVVPDVAAAPVALPGSLRRLDRDHVGAEVRQRLYAHGAEQEMIEADDANSLQQVEHRMSPTPSAHSRPRFRGTNGCTQPDARYCVSSRSGKRCRFSVVTAASISDPAGSVKSGTTPAIRISLSPSRMARSCSSPSASVTLTVPLKRTELASPGGPSRICCGRMPMQTDRPTREPRSANRAVGSLNCHPRQASKKWSASAVTSTVMKFIDGEPMKLATNRFAGLR